MSAIAWTDADTASYTAESAAFPYGVIATVCLDDEGPLRPAFYWDVTQHGERVLDGWAPTIARARRAAIAAAKGQVTA